MKFLKQIEELFAERDAALDNFEKIKIAGIHIKEAGLDRSKMRYYKLW